MDKNYQVKVYRNKAYRVLKGFNSLTAAFDLMTAEKRNSPDGRFRLTQGRKVLRTA